MTGPENERTYRVDRKKEGIYVTDIDTDATFFRTNCGGWFLVQGGDSLFTEDVEFRHGTEMAKYLSEIVVTSNTAPKSISSNTISEK